MATRGARFVLRPRGVGRRVSRVIASLVFGLQALLFGGGTIADAHAAAESLTRQSHIEDGQTSKCAPFHSEVDCLVCRTLSGGAARGAGAPLVQLLAFAPKVGDETNVVVADRFQGGPLGSRAPPRG